MMNKYYQVNVCVVYDCVTCVWMCISCHVSNSCECLVKKGNGPKISISYLILSIWNLNRLFALHQYVVGVALEGVKHSILWAYQDLTFLYNYGYFDTTKYHHMYKFTLMTIPHIFRHPIKGMQKHLSQPTNLQFTTWMLHYYRVVFMSHWLNNVNTACALTISYTYMDANHKAHGT